MRGHPTHQPGAPARLSAILLAAACGLLGCKQSRRSAPPPKSSRVAVIDVHAHFSPRTAKRTLKIMAAQGIAHIINLSGGYPGRGLEQQLAAAKKSQGRISVMCNIPWRALPKVAGFVPKVVGLLERCRALGAVGLKIPKGLGLGYPDGRGGLLRVDDPRLGPIFEAAGRLSLPVTIHTGDPQAFWRPNTPDNERYDELKVHPGWSFHGQPVPSWEALWQQFATVVRRHRKTKFLGVHFGNAPEEPARVAALLDSCPNLFIDTAARIPEIGRQPPAKLRAFFLKYSDRILFGTDLGVYPRGGLMLGSGGAETPGPAEIRHFYRSSWRFFETGDKNFRHPTPIQGRWRISGINLPAGVRRKIYRDNALRLFGLKLPKRP